MKKKETELDKFLTAVQEYIDYWAELEVDEKRKQYLKDTKMTEEYWRCRGLAFSILCLIDGVSSANDFHMYDLNYKGKTFNDCYMHDKLSDYEKK